MNYFGHAALAVWRSRTEPRESAERYILGAMLPDLLPMVGAKLRLQHLDEDVARGIQFHLEVDALFHETSAFVTMNRKALTDLRQLGISRGPARACAHMGVEMLIDSHLIEDAELLDGYLKALTVGARATDVHRGQDSGSIPSIMGLCGHLLDRGPWVHAVTEERFERRLGGALTHRPRLAPTAEELTLIAKYLCRFTLVRTEMPFLLDQLRPLLTEQ
jgi:hypothetical protein